MKIFQWIILISYIIWNREIIDYKNNFLKKDKKNWLITNQKPTECKFYNTYISRQI